MAEVTITRTYKNKWGDNVRSTARAELKSLGNQAPYFSITVDTYTVRGRKYAFGMQHDEVRDHFPEFTPYLRWHLTSTEGPMHYIANALYWAGKSGWCNGGKDDPPNVEYFKSTIVYGAVPGDDERFADVLALSKQEITARLQARFGALMDAFMHDMNTLFGEGTVVYATPDAPVSAT